MVKGEGREDHVGMAEVDFEESAAGCRHLMTRAFYATFAVLGAALVAIGIFDQRQPPGMRVFVVTLGLFTMAYYAYAWFTGRRRG